MTAPPIEISVFDEENTPRPDTGPHAAKQSNGLTHVLKQEPAVHDIVAAGLIPVPDVQQPELRVAQPAPHGLAPGQAKFDLVHVDTGDRSPRIDKPGDLKRDNTLKQLLGRNINSS